MTMIEQVARAIFASQSFYGDDQQKPAWVDGGNSTRQDDARRLARAAIAAMREPTEAMCEAVVPFPEHLRAEHPDPVDPWHWAMKAATLAEQAAAGNRYSRMIDAALAEEP